MEVKEGKVEEERKQRHILVGDSTGAWMRGEAGEEGWEEGAGTLKWGRKEKH